MNRLPEVELLPACRHYGFGVVPYSPLARGVLTGKYDPGEAPDPSTRAGRGDRWILQAEVRKESLIIAKKLKTYAESEGTTPGGVGNCLDAEFQGRDIGPAGSAYAATLAR
jgi:aryl-alcohol dehydrogenase-like predicted oxidoreductase